MAESSSSLHPLTPKLDPGSEPPSSGRKMPAVSETRELVMRAQAGDARALNDLFARYYDRIYRIVRIRLGARLRGLLDTHDLVQETCAVALRKINEFEMRNDQSLIQWLARIAEHQITDAADYHRAGKRDPKRVQPLEAAPRPNIDDSCASVQLAASGASPSSIVANAELKEIYDVCVESLAQDQREVILLRDYAHTSWEEIAKELCRPSVGATRELYRRAQIRLGQALRLRLRP